MRVPLRLIEMYREYKSKSKFSDYDNDRDVTKKSKTGYTRKRIEDMKPHEKKRACKESSRTPEEIRKEINDLHNLYETQLRLPTGDRDFTPEEFEDKLSSLVKELETSGDDDLSKRSRSEISRESKIKHLADLDSRIWRAEDRGDWDSVRYFENKKASYLKASEKKVQESLYISTTSLVEAQIDQGDNVEWFSHHGKSHGIVVGEDNTRLVVDWDNGGTSTQLPRYLRKI